MTEKIKAHLMVDLETLGTTADSIILSIGAVAFNPLVTTKSYDHRFYSGSLNIGQHGRIMADNTFRWWLQQSEHARDDHKERGDNLSDALQVMADRFRDFDCYVWGYGSDFDVALLNHAFNSFDIKPPWSRYNIRCFRSFVAFFDPFNDCRPYENNHNALDDALNQAAWMRTIIEREPDARKAIERMHRR